MTDGCADQGQAGEQVHHADEDQVLAPVSALADEDAELQRRLAETNDVS